MAKHKDGKKHKKGSQFVIRVDKAERDAFVTLCEQMDTSAAREMRRFMRDWVAAHSPRPDGAEPTPEPAATESAPAEAEAPAAAEPPAAARPQRKRKTVAA